MSTQYLKLCCIAAKANLCVRMAYSYHATFKLLLSEIQYTSSYASSTSALYDVVESYDARRQIVALSYKGLNQSNLFSTGSR